ncbi:hypothetical protein HMN09_00327600 [Mycena chlorophos]|uniref:Cytochrome P450 n=1 Tax=Mycena chlorophos TaxID=658473 RepID=A0A8H6TGD1_MYCCL|nr:hypothetical protein HMN09_00327600 [Mycena chlorophos]
MHISPGIRFLLPLLASLSLLVAVANRFRLLFVVLVALPLLFVLNIYATRLRQYIRARQLGARLVPVPRGKWPGNFDILRDLRRAWNTDYPLEVLRKILHDTGTQTLNMWIGCQDHIVTTEPEHIKTVLATDFLNYEKGKGLRGSMHSMLGTGVFNSDGDMWKWHRNATRPFFNKQRISDFDTFARHADRAISCMRDRLRAGYAVDFQDLASRFTMDSATAFLFGACVNSLDATPLPYAHNACPTTPAGPSANPNDAFTCAYNRAIEQTSSRTRWGGLWPLFELVRDETREPMRVVDAYIEPIIAAAVKRKENAVHLTGPEKFESETLLDELLNQTSDAKVLKDEVLNILLAGRDTTMSLSTFVVYFLSVYPAVFTRLRSEIIEQVGIERTPTYEDIRELKYLRAVLNETMRLYPPVPSNLRECLRETTWASTDPTQLPFYIPAGTKIMYSVFLMHRRKDLWGPTADEFDPNRFLDDRLRKYVISNPFCFLPFNAGPRVCLGQQFAYNEASFLVIRLLQSFSAIQLDEEACPPQSRVPEAWRAGEGRMKIERFRARQHLTMSCEGGLWVRMVESD